jgi:arabinose-5-phosphate isomerase
MIQIVDLVLAISNSGESEELTAILPMLKRLGAPLVAMTGNADSALARHADVFLDCGVEKEACPLNLAPTASTTAQLAMGDALAVALLDARGFKAEDFARSHPGGALGRKLLTHVSDVMRSGAQVPQVGPQATFSDLRRLVEQGLDLRTLTAKEAMHPNPSMIRSDALAAEAAELMELLCITSVLVLDEHGLLCGAINSNDLMRAKVI